MVTVMDVLTAALALKADVTTAESYVNDCCLVPTAAETVITIVRLTAFVRLTLEDGPQRTIVFVVQAVVAHASSSLVGSTAVGVASEKSKFKIE